MTNKRGKKRVRTSAGGIGGKAAVGAGIALAVVGAVAVTVGLTRRAAQRRSAFQGAADAQLVEDINGKVDRAQQHSDRREQRKKNAAATVWTLFTGAVSFVFTIILQFLGFMLSALLSKLTLGPIGGILGFFADVLLNFVLLCVLFAILYKRLFPERKLKELFTLKNLGWILLGSVLLSALRVGASLIVPQYAVWGAIAQCMLSMTVIVFVWYKAFKQTGYFGSQIKKALFSKTGAVAFLSLALGSVAFALIKVLLASIATVGPFAHITVLFFLCAAVCFGGFRLIRGVQKRLDVSALIENGVQ